MAPTKPQGFAKPKKTGESGEELFKRRSRAMGVDWRKVNPSLLACAMTTALGAGHALMFTAAAGGVGVCISVFVDGTKQREYAMSAEEVEELLNLIIDGTQSSSEDAREAFGLSE